MAKTAISLKSVSEKTIVRDLYEFVQSHPEESKWIDFLESSAGTTIMELIAAYGYFKFYHETMMARESKIETAIMKSSIIELAFNRGLLLAPTRTGHISLTFMAEDNYTLLKGTSIGFMSDYDVILLSSVMCKKDTEYTVECCIGHMNEFEDTMYGFGPFSQKIFNTQDKYIASELEELTVNGSEVGILSDLNYLSKYGNNFCVRRVRDNEVKIYTGNGNLGYMHEGVSEIRYQCISYGDDLQNKMSSTPNLTITSNFISYSIISYPDFTMNKDKIKGLAAYYPIDGRVVQDKDYEIAINKYFGGIVKDAYAYNSDPNEEVYVITTENVVDGDKKAISEMIDNRRGMGIQVFYHWMTINEGKELSIDVAINENNIYSNITDDITGFFESLLFKFPRKEIVYSSKDLASQLSSYFGFPVYDRSVDEIKIRNYLDETGLSVAEIDVNGNITKLREIGEKFTFYKDDVIHTVVKESTEVNIIKLVTTIKTLGIGDSVTYSENGKTFTLGKTDFIKNIQINVQPIENDLLYMDEDIQKLKLS